MTCHKGPQGRQIIAELMRRPMTYGDMLALGISVCPWKRVSESLKPGEQLVRKEGRDGLVRWRVRRFAA